MHLEGAEQLNYLWDLNLWKSLDFDVTTSEGTSLTLVIRVINTRNDY